MNDSAFISVSCSRNCCVAGIPQLVKKLQSQGKAVFLVSGGFRQVIHPIAESLGIPLGNVYANQLLFKVSRIHRLPSHALLDRLTSSRQPLCCSWHSTASRVYVWIDRCLVLHNQLLSKFHIILCCDSYRLMAAMLALIPRSSHHTAMAKQQQSERSR